MADNLPASTRTVTPSLEAWHILRMCSRCVPGTCTLQLAKWSSRHRSPAPQGAVHREGPAPHPNDSYVKASHCTLLHHNAQRLHRRYTATRPCAKRSCTKLSILICDHDVTDLVQHPSQVIPF
jgi:hypothetical protein